MEDKNNSLPSIEDALKDFDESVSNINEVNKEQPVQKSNIAHEINTIQDEEPKVSMAQPVKEPSLVEMMHEIENNKKENVVKDEKYYLQYYIGNNYERYETGGISWAYFFFGEYYLIFRKMYIPAVIKYIISNILLVVGILAYPKGEYNTTIYCAIAYMIIQLLPIFFIKSFYFNYSKEKVKQLLEQNKGKSEEELIKICKSTGGTNIVPVIILIVILAVLRNIRVPSFITNAQFKTSDLYVRDLYTLKTKYLKLESGNSNVEYFKLNECYVGIKTEQVGEDYIINDYDVEKRIINNTIWNYKKEIESEKYYAVHNSYLYTIETKVINDNEACKKSVDILIQNLQFK